MDKEETNTCIWRHAKLREQLENNAQPS